MLQHVRHQPDLARGADSRTRDPGGTKDLRWQILDLIKRCRHRLNLRDRDITVLRGLLTFLPAQFGPGQMVVFPSNRILIERCDGIDERTLRRRIAQLQRVGLIVRRSSPNGKRYRIHTEHPEALVAYGIDLTPAFVMKTDLEALAADCHREALQRSSLLAKIRHALFNFSRTGSEELREEARLSLRRAITNDQLVDILARLEDSNTADRSESTVTSDATATKMTARGGQNDRHIQISNKESYESDVPIPAGRKTSRSQKSRRTAGHPSKDISVAECMELAKTSNAMAPATPQSWADVLHLSSSLAPAIGLTTPIVHAAEKHLGRHGCALAILGLVEALDRITNPGAYLRSLAVRAERQGIDPVQMFRSLTRPRAQRSLHA
ncbi:MULTISPECIES: plasmid replication protein RepC [unclassified Haematobacter]|uniref:plasmid replication protein RepC n=1 Tax=unclassified Haematobacter TaxID=2640585 RepID=UPI003917E34C